MSSLSPWVSRRGTADAGRLEAGLMYPEVLPSLRVILDAQHKPVFQGEMVSRSNISSEHEKTVREQMLLRPMSVPPTWDSCPYFGISLVLEEQACPSDTMPQANGLFLKKTAVLLLGMK